MPMTAYVDGSGTHRDSEILTLAVCVMASEVITPFTELWNGTLARHGLSELHMRKFERSNGMPTDTVQTICDILNAIGRFSRDFLYLRSCSVVKADYENARRTVASIKPLEHLCVDFCLGGLSIPTEDLGKSNTITVQFDRGEPFHRSFERVWNRQRKNPTAGWPRQVRDTQQVNATRNPGIQMADLFAWAINRQQRRQDQPLLAFASFISIRHASCRYSGNPDFRIRACTWSSSGELVCHR